MSDASFRTATAKAQKINLDLERYGTFAEIGAGQEVARHFFLAGRASQTIAKSMSAYDMTFSDEIYGREKNGRYVCESRLEKMLEKEYSLLIRRLDGQRGDKTCFFAFANTVATGTPETPRCHGWMGIRFQTHPRGEANEILLHVRMMDRHRLMQQEALGILGVNLAEAAFYGLQKPQHFIDSLVENLKSGQILLDVLKFRGPDLKAFQDRHFNLELVRRGLAEAVLFSPSGEILNVSDSVYGKALLIQRGEFRPITTTHLDVVQKGLEQMKLEIAQQGEKKAEVLSVMEMVLPAACKTKDLEDVSQRIDMIGSCGLPCLVSNFHLFYQLKHFFRRSTQLPMALIMDASKIERLFQDGHYKNLEGGLLEGLAKLFDEKTKIYIYPHKTDKACLTAQSATPKGERGLIYDYFRRSGQIVDVAGCDETDTYWHSSDVMKLVTKKEKGWEKLIPPAALVGVKAYLKGLTN